MDRVRALFGAGTFVVGGLLSGPLMAQSPGTQPPRAELSAPAPTPAPPPTSAPAAAPAPTVVAVATPAPASRSAPSARPTPAPAPARPPVPSKVALAAAAKPEPPVAVSASPEPAPAVEAKPAASPEHDPWARPHFVKGDLSNFVIRPMTRKNFIGVGAGISAIPTDASTLLNAFYFTVEPQADIVGTRNWRLGLGAPLQFELVDTRGAFETCIGQGRSARASGGDQTSVNLTTAGCISQQKDRLTQNMGRLRRADWDQASDFAKVIRYLVIGGQEQPFYLNLSRLYDQTFGHGTVVRDYNANIDYNAARVGATHGMI